MTEAAAARIVGSALLCVAAAGVSCSRGQPAKERVERADTLFSQQKYAEVIQQSRRALDANHNDAGATALLGRAHLALAEFGQAYGELLKARNLDPSDKAVRLDLASYYVIERQIDQAREQAAFVAREDPADLTAWMLLGATARTPHQIDDAIRTFSRIRLAPGDSARAQVALATLNVKKRDTAAAATLLRTAVANYPRSAEARTALASFYRLAGQTSQAEQERASAAAITPQPARVPLAKFLVTLGYRSDAKSWLADVAAGDSETVAARRLLVELQVADGDTEAMRSVSELLRDRANDPELLVQRGRSRLRTHDAAAAATDFRRASQVAPGFAPARYYLALAEIDGLDSASNLAIAKSAVGRAGAELDSALALVPNYPEALFKRADLKIRSGEGRSAIRDLDGFVSANPGSIRGHELLAGALAASGRTAEATETFHRLIDIDPERAESHYELGVSLQTTGHTADATREFEKALALAPAYADPMTQLVLLDLADNKSAAALERINQQLARVPQSGPLYDLLGLVHAARNELPAAESAYRRAVQLQPSLVDGYVRLAELYDATGRFDQAIANADTARRLDPRNLRALMALGIGHQQRGDSALAREAYEAALHVNPGFAGAANNLAYLLADEPGGQAKALEYASLAKKLAPDDPHIADTFGWILYKRGDYARAMTALKEAATRLANSPAVLYHLGMTAQKMGDIDTARAALTKALAAPGDFQGKEDARRALAQLK